MPRLLRVLQPVRRLPDLIIATVLAGNPAAHAELAEDYTKEIRPLMTKKCYECQNATKTKGDLNLERFRLQAVPAITWTQAA